MGPCESFKPCVNATALKAKVDDYMESEYVPILHWPLSLVWLLFEMSVISSQSWSKSPEMKEKPEVGKCFVQLYCESLTPSEL
jgi:hypothetical protein